MNGGKKLILIQIKVKSINNHEYQQQYYLSINLLKYLFERGILKWLN